MVNFLRHPLKGLEQSFKHDTSLWGAAAGVTAGVLTANPGVGAAVGGAITGGAAGAAAGAVVKQNIDESRAGKEANQSQKKLTDSYNREIEVTQKKRALEKKRADREYIRALRASSGGGYFGSGGEGGGRGYLGEATIG